MRDFLNEYQGSEKPVLIIGKGPTLDRIKEVDLSKYTTVGMNEVIRSVKCDFAHTIHSEIITKYTQHLGTFKYILSPYYVQVGRGYWVPVESFYKDPNIFCYNLHTSSNRLNGSAVIEMEAFSIHPIYELFALKGVKEFFTIGVDGGDPVYSKSMMQFEDQVKNITKNASIPNFAGYNFQFKRVNLLKEKYGFTVTRLFNQLDGR